MVKGGDFVKLKGLKTESLNGRIGVVHNKNHDTGRLNVALSEGRVLALKEDNLEVIPQPGFLDAVKDLSQRKQAEYKEKGLSQFSKDTLKELTDTIAATLPSDVDPKIALGSFAALFLGSIIFLGFLKAILVTYSLFSVFVVCFPVYKSSGGGINGARRAFDALASKAQQGLQQSFGSSVNLSLNQAKIAVAVYALVVGYLVFLTGNPSASNLSTSGDAYTYEMYQKEVSSKGKLTEAFKSGFLEGQNDANDLDTSLSRFLSNLQDSEEAAVPVERLESVGNGGKSSFFSVTKIIPLALSGKLLFDIGQQSSWNLQSAVSIFLAKPLYQKMMLGFVIVRFFI